MTTTRVDRAAAQGASSSQAAWFLQHWRTWGAIALALAALAGVSSIVIALRAAQGEGLVAHTFEIRQTARDLFSSIQDAETGQRGYLLRQNQSYLEPYQAALKSIPEIYAKLQALIADNEAQRNRLARLKTLVDDKLAELAQTVQLASEGKSNAALEAVYSDRGKKVMDQIRTESASFASEALQELNERQQNVAALRTALLVLIAISLIAAVAIASVLGRAAQRSMTDLRHRTRELEVEAERRQQAEDTLRQSQKIEAVGQLTGGIAHDFNNALTIIMGNLDIMRRRLRAADAGPDSRVESNTLSRYLDNASAGARNAAQLTQRLLAFSRRQALNPVRLDLNRSIAEMSELLRRTLGETVNIETVLAGGLWPTFVDTNQLENAIVNLAINARDAMPDGGRVTIETANAVLDDAYARRFGDVAPGQYVVLSITDTGHGIPPDIMHKIFEPFFTTKEVGKGSGLGLAMIHGFVKQSNGHIRVYSEIGQGTTVKIYLPRLHVDETINSAPVVKEPLLSPTPVALSGEKILVVEDNDAVRAYAVASLEDLGYRVSAVADAAQALRVLRERGPFNMLFTDVVLTGGVNGRQLADQVVEQDPNIKVLFTTGYTRNAIVHHGKLDPGVQLLSKPYTQEELARKLRDILDRPGQST